MSARQAPNESDDNDHGRPYLFCYDIADDKTRAAVSRRLTGYGTRLQFSVFECWLSRGELRGLLRQLGRVVAATSADVRVFEVGQATSDLPGRGGPAAYWMV